MLERPLSSDCANNANSVACILCPGFFSVRRGLGNSEVSLVIKVTEDALSTLKLKTSCGKESSNK